MGKPGEDIITGDELECAELFNAFLREISTVMKVVVAESDYEAF